MNDVFEFMVFFPWSMLTVPCMCLLLHWHCLCRHCSQWDLLIFLADGANLRQKKHDVSRATNSAESTQESWEDHGCLKDDRGLLIHWLIFRAVPDGDIVVLVNSKMNMAPYLKSESMKRAKQQ